MIKYIFARKLYLVSEVNAGKSIKALSREYNLHENKLLEWSRLYERYGNDGLKKQPKLKPMPDFKEKGVRLILEKGVLLSHVLIDYRISRTALESWVRLTRNKGYTALRQSQRRGRPPKDMGRPKKKEPQTELEKFQAENIRLRAENALLKKAKALVEEKKTRAHLNGQKASTD